MKRLSLKLRYAACVLSLAATVGCSSTPSSQALQLTRGLEIDEGLRDVRLTEDQMADWNTFIDSGEGAKEAFSLSRAIEKSGNAAIFASATHSAFLSGGFSWAALGSGPIAVASLFNFMFEGPLTATVPAIAIRAPVSDYKNLEEFERAVNPKVMTLIRSVLGDMGWTTSMAPHVRTEEYRWENRRWEKTLQDIVISKQGVCDQCIALTIFSGFGGGKDTHYGMNSAVYKSTFVENGEKKKYYVKIASVSFRGHSVWDNRKESGDANLAYQLWQQQFYGAVGQRASDDVIVYVPHFSNLPTSMPVVYHKGKPNYFVKQK